MLANIGFTFLAYAESRFSHFFVHRKRQGSVKGQPMNHTILFSILLPKAVISSLSTVVSA